MIKLPNTHHNFVLYYFAEELLINGMDYLTKELRRRSKRSRYFGYNPRKRRNEFNNRRYQKELARAHKLQNRRSKSKVFIRTPASKPKPQSNVTQTPHGSSEVQRAVAEKLGKLKEKIQGIRQRLGALRDRRKKLLLISARDKFLEYPCPCNHGNDTARDVKGNYGNDQYQISSLRRRNKLPKAPSRKTETKKKKGKAKPRRSMCASPGMNCFYQTEDHWKLPPLWTGKYSHIPSVKIRKTNFSLSARHMGLYV